MTTQFVVMSKRDGAYESLSVHRTLGGAKFLAYARAHPELTFEVTRVGCGLAGYTDADIAPLFKGAPSNCTLPDGWPNWDEALRDGEQD